MFESRDLTLFFVEQCQLGYTDQANRGKGIAMTIALKRKIMSEMMTTYLPSILLLMITFATTFFKPVYFEAALTVNLTNMLVMTTIFMSVMERLPTTSYLKMIDYWLVFCQLVPFTEVIFHKYKIIENTSKVILLTAIEAMREEKKQKKRKKTRKKTRMKQVKETTNTDLPLESTPRSTPLEVTSVESAEAWTDQKRRTTKYRFIDGLKIMGEWDAVRTGSD